MPGGSASPIIALAGSLFLVGKQIERTGDGVVLAPDVRATLGKAVGELTAALKD